MIRDAVNFIELLANQVTFVSCLAIFLGGGYVALHSRVMPKWAVTGIWYIGLAALLNAITILVEWTSDQFHPLSHFQLGTATNTVFILSIAAMVMMLFFNTVWKDYQGSKTRGVEPVGKPGSTRSRIKSGARTVGKKVASRARTIVPKRPDKLEL